MAFMDQARKSSLTAACKVALAKWPGVKWTLSVRHHSTIVLTISQGNIDFEADAILHGQREEETGRLHDGYVQVNEYSIDRDWRGEAGAFLAAAKAALMVGNHNRSDIQADYHDVGWYVNINVGRWNKPYVFTGQPSAAPVEAPAVEAAAAPEYPPMAEPCPVCGSTEDHTGLVCIARPQEPSRLLHPKPLGIDEMHEVTSSPEALIARSRAVAAEMFGAPAPVDPEPAVRASSFLSPIELIGAEQHEADYLGACIDNLVGPVRRGQLTARQALERVARTAFQAGFTAGDRYARSER